jgi:CRP/FNR family cyclic AMP-dependent transcriptional regulator
MSAAFFPHLTCIELSKAERIKLLDGTSWHQEFTWSELETLSTYTEAYQAAPATTLVSEGSREAFMGIVIEGQIAVLKRDQSGVQRTIARIRAGKIFGEMSLIDGEPRSATLQVNRTAVMLIISKLQFERMGIEAPRLALKFVLMIARQLSQRLRQTSGILVDVLQN